MLLQVLTTNEVGNVKSSNRSKTGRLESQKLSKSKKLSKSRNLPKFVTKKVELNFLTFDARTAFNCLRLAFIKAPIF